MWVVRLIPLYTFSDKILHETYRCVQENLQAANLVFFLVWTYLLVATRKGFLCSLAFTTARYPIFEKGDIPNIYLPKAILTSRYT